MISVALLQVLFWPALEADAQEPKGLRGDPAAIADAGAMVESMGGMAIWRELQSVHFVHEWDIFNRPDIYLENEILERERAGEGEYEYRFRVDLFRLWVRQAHSVWQ